MVRPRHSIRIKGEGVTYAIEPNLLLLPSVRSVVLLFLSMVAGAFVHQDTRHPTHDALAAVLQHPRARHIGSSLLRPIHTSTSERHGTNQNCVGAENAREKYLSTQIYAADSVLLSHSERRHKFLYPHIYSRRVPSVAFTGFLYSGNMLVKACNQGSWVRDVPPHCSISSKYLTSREVLKIHNFSRSRSRTI